MLSPFRYWRVLAAVAAVLVLPLVFAACSSSEERAADEDSLALVWEAWREINENHADADSLEASEAAGGAIYRLLESGKVEPYPFLTDLGRMRGQAPPYVPADLTDVWRATVLYGRLDANTGDDALAETLLQGLAEGLGDSLSAFVNADRYPEARTSLEQSVQGSYQGIGSRVFRRDGMFIMVPFEGSPSEKAGIEPGDVLISVDGAPVEGLTTSAVVDMVKEGEEGTKVKLQLGRAGESELVELDVFRGQVEQPSIRRQLTPGGIGYVGIDRFRDNTGDQVYDALEALSQIDMLALILDLRNNPGGSLGAAGEVAAQFLPPGTLFRYTDGPDGERQEYRLDEEIDSLELNDLLLAVLVDERTRGAAEALAAVLQEGGRAVLVGAETFGQGSDYGFVELSDGSAIYLPTSRWYTASGLRLGERGVKPDMEVAYEEVEDGIGGERQFNQAYEYLDGQLPPFR